MTIREIAKIITKHPKIVRKSNVNKFEHILSKELAKKKD